MNIIDYHGLNDYVIARSPPSWDRMRWMAHERYPPPGYVESFAPNVAIVGNQIVVTQRQKELRAEDIMAIERDWARRITNK